MVFDFFVLCDFFYSWGEGMSEGNGWNVLFYNNYD